MWGLWILIYLLLLLLFLLLKKKKDLVALIRKLIKEGEKGLHEHHLAIAVSDYYRIKLMYKDLNERDKERVIKEILDYYKDVKKNIHGGN